MEEIMDIIIRIIAMLLALGAGVLGKYLVNWIKSNTDGKTAEMLDLFIGELVAAAEQIYKKEDPDGSVRLAYVQKMLVEAGYEITDAVMALIESKVFSINLVNRAAEEIMLDTPVIGFQDEALEEDEDE